MHMGKGIDIYSPRFIEKNIISSLFVKRRSKYYMSMKYEDFIDQPISEIDCLEAFCSMSFSETKDIEKNRNPIFPSKSMAFRGMNLAKDEVVFDPNKTKRHGAYNSKLFWVLLMAINVLGYRY